MQIVEIDKRLVAELESCHKEFGADKIHAGSSMDLINNEHYLYPIFVFRNGVKQKIQFDGEFIKNNDYETVLEKIKQTIKDRV